MRAGGYHLLDRSQRTQTTRSFAWAPNTPTHRRQRRGGLPRQSGEYLTCSIPKYRVTTAAFAGVISTRTRNRNNRFSETTTRTIGRKMKRGTKMKDLPRGRGQRQRWDRGQLLHLLAAPALRNLQARKMPRKPVSDAGAAQLTPGSWFRIQWRNMTLPIALGLLTLPRLR